MPGRAFICDDVIGTFFKKQKCPHCNVKLKRKKVSKVIDAKSEEAKGYSFRIVSHTVKRMRFSWYEFECPVCQRSFTVQALDKIGKK